MRLLAAMLAAVGGAAAQMAKTDRTLPPFQDRLHLGLHLKALGLKTGVELGVRTGDFAAALLHIWPASRYMLVDAWRQLYSGQYSRELPSAYMRTMNQTIRRSNCEETFESAMAGGRCGTQIQVCRNWTHVCAELLEDHSIDFVYVDALHDYKGTLRDISMWWPKLRTGGVMAGHDYIDMNSSWMNHADAAKVRHWRRNYDASWEPTGKLVKGAVDDFFDCRAVVRNEQVFTPDGAYGHRREVEVAPPRKWSHQLASALGSKLAPVKNSQDVYPPTWAVLK